MALPNNRSHPPLLSETLSHDGPALLGGVPCSDMDESPLERLIARTTATHLNSSPLFLMDEPVYLPSMDEEDPVNSPSSIFCTTIITQVAGTLCLLHIGLVWASFLSNPWFETHLKVTIALDGSWSKFVTDQLLQESSLASLISMLLGADQGWAAMVLVVTGLVFPCLAMILCTSWTFGDYQQAIRPYPRQAATQMDLLLGFDPRVFVENFIVRIAFLTFFLLSILDVGTSSLALENNHSEFLVTNRARGGLVCYTLGMSCALLVIIILRVVSPSALQPPRTTTTRTMSTRDRLVHPRAPPEEAFHELHRPLLSDEVEPVTQTTPVSSPNSAVNDRDVPLWQRILVYEVEILTLVFWIPALFMPLCEIKFDGLVASFMDETSLEVPFYLLPSLLWQRGKAAGTDQWILLLLGIPLLVLVYIVPFLATMLASAAWRSSNNSKILSLYKSMLRYLQPALGGPVFALAVLLAMPAMKPLGDFLLDSETSGFCRRFESVTDTSCLDILGHHRLGLWFLLAQSITLEIYVRMILTWKR